MTKAKVLIKSAALVTEEGVKQADLLIEGEKIARIDSSISSKGKVREINAEGKIVFPGIVDPHVHFELEAYKSLSSDDFFTGSRAAAAGGVTTFIDFAVPRKGQDMVSRIREKSKSASAKSIVDFSFHAQITGWDSSTPAEMKKVVQEGVRSFKIFMPSTEGWGVNDYGLFRAMKVSSSIDSLIMVHAENGVIAGAMEDALKEKGKTSMSNFLQTRPEVVEREAVSRACLLAEEAGAAVYICHLSGGGASRDLRALKRKGRDVLVETSPQYLLLNSEIYKQQDAFLYACLPPLRTAEDNYQLWRAIFENTVETIGTDHCPFLSVEKEAGNGSFADTPMGLGGVETSLGLLYTEGAVKRNISLEKIMRITSLNPAKIFGLYPRKGTLKEGSDADLVLFNPAKKVKLKAKKMFSNCDYSPYEGRRLNGWVETTISRGEIIYKNSKMPGKKGRGKFLRRKAFELPDY